ncbi:putative aldose 1-/Glucose-6-phosphate 1-epimerase, galactose mutarotase-like domain superfamily [Helianthus anomalus]
MAYVDASMLGSFFAEEEKPHSVRTEFNKLFGRQKPVHHILGGGKSADVLMWRNKKILASVLFGATAVWVLFEWLDYNFIPLFANFGTLEQHGFARNRLWSLDDDPSPLTPANNQSTVYLLLKSTEEDLKTWPYRFLYVHHL